MKKILFGFFVLLIVSFSFSQENTSDQKEIDKMEKIRKMEQQKAELLKNRVVELVKYLETNLKLDDKANEKSKSGLSMIDRIKIF